MNSKQSTKHAMDLTLFPRFASEFRINAEAIVLPKLTKLRHDYKNENDFEFVNSLTLADPSFLRESEIDIILGASEYTLAIKMGLVKNDEV